MHRHCREFIGAECGKDARIKRGVPGDSPLYVIGNAVVPADLVEQFGDEARHAAQARDISLPAQPAQCSGLRDWRRGARPAI
jgi:hypothetical protein